MIFFYNINTPVKNVSRVIYRTGRDSCRELLCKVLGPSHSCKKSLIKEISLNSQLTHYVVLSAIEPTMSVLQKQRISHPGKLFHNRPFFLKGFFVHKIYKLKFSILICCHCRGK